MFLRFKTFLILFLLLISSASWGMTLRESVEIALQSNPEILAQNEKIKENEGIVGQAQAGYLPSLKLTGEYGRDYRTPVSYPVLPGINFTLFPDEAASVTSYQANLTQALYTGGKISSNVDLAKANLEIAKEELKKQAQQITYKVISAYNDLLRTEQALKLSEQAAVLAAAHLKQVTNYFYLGRAPKNDLLRAEVRVAQEKINKIQALNAREEALFAFNDLLGREIENVVSSEVAVSELKMVDLPNYQELIALAWAERPEGKIIKLQKKMAESEINLAKSSYFPSLALNGNAGQSITNYPGAGTKQEVSNWNIYGVLAWELFDGLETQNKVKAAQAKQAQVDITEKQWANRIATEVKSARAYFQAAAATVAAAHDAVNFAQENLRLALEGYKKGVRDNLEFLEAQNTLDRANLDWLTARVNYVTAQARLNLAVGKELLLIP
jgi:outer membrane protein TolC